MFLCGYNIQPSIHTCRFILEVNVNYWSNCCGEYFMRVGRTWRHMTLHDCQEILHILWLYFVHFGHRCVPDHDSHNRLKRSQILCLKPESMTGFTCSISSQCHWRQHEKNSQDYTYGDSDNQIYPNGSVHIGNTMEKWDVRMLNIILFREVLLLLSR